MRSTKTTTNTRESTSITYDVQEPSLLTRAKLEGKTSAYAGKRKWSRHDLGTRIKIATDPTIPNTAWEVTLHNISGGGLGFWSKRSLELGTHVYVFDDAGQPPHWLSANVCHCTAGLRGYLIGASFLEPMAENADGLGYHDIEEQSDNITPHSSFGIVWPLRVQWTLGIAAASTLTIALARFVLPLLGLTNPFWIVQTTELLMAAGIGALVGWLIARKDHVFVTSLRRALRGLATGKHFHFELAETTTREFVSIGRAFQELCSKWQLRAREEQIQRRRLEDITRMKMNLLSIVSHDLRTPLTSILMYAQMLDEDLETMEITEKRKFLNIINQECHRLSRLVDDVLVVQRLEANAIQLDLKPLDLSEVVRNTVRTFEPIAREKLIALAVECQDELPSVKADADKLAQVISNLVSNALKYTSVGGRVTISVEAWGQEIVLRVADNGPGIPRNKWDHIFDRFAQAGDPNVRSVDGFGLGLFIVRKIVSDHGGRVWLDSQVGQGTEFFAAFPSASSITQQPVQEESDSPSCNILVCDSDPELVASISHTLQTKKHDVLVAHCASRLLEQLDNNDIDILITDVLFPDMDSQELLASLCERSNRLFRTIIHSYEGDANEYSRLGVDVFLQRPVSINDLLQAVHVATRRRLAAGLTVVLVEADSSRTKRLQDVLECSGHTTILAESASDGMLFARDYSADAIIIPRSQLDSSWTELDELRYSDQQPSLVVLCESITREDRKLEQQHNAVALVCKPGSEETIIDTLMASQGVQTAEVA